MTKIYFIKKFEEEFIEKIKNDSIIFPLDYKSLDILKNKKIKFELIDDILTDEERKELFLKCRDVWEKFSKVKNNELEYENINIFRN